MVLGHPDHGFQQATSPALIGDGVMDNPTPEVASPTPQSGDDSNVSSSQAAAILFQQELKSAPPTTPIPVLDPPAPEKEAVETPAETEAPVAPAETENPPPEETESTPAEEPAPEGGEEKVLSKKSSLDPKLQEEIQKRINKEVAKRKELEDKLSQFELELRQAKQASTPPQPPPKGKAPLAEYNDLESLQKYEAQAKEAARWAEQKLEDENLGDGVQVGETVYSRDQLKAIKYQARLALEDLIPARKQFLTTRAQVSQQAAAMFPWMQDPKSEEFQLAVSAYRSNPWLLDQPNADYIVGVQVEGMKALKAKNAPKPPEEAKPKVVKPKIPASRPASDQTAVSSGTSVGRVPSLTAARSAFNAEKEKILSKGSVSASEAAVLLQRSEQLRKSN